MKRCALAAVIFLLSAAGAPLPAAEPVVRVILWFDTEDYLLPASDDAARRVAEILTARGIRGTFKVVGEKARVLERRGRADVVAALQKHDIGYHSNLHSVHPAPAEYLAEAGWTDGVAEFVRREGAGARDVMRVFGVPSLSCYGQPGSSWAPQAVAGLRAIGVVTAAGVPAYVDEGNNVGFDEKPFWYAGALNVYNMGRNQVRMDLHAPGGLEKGRAEFKAAYERLRAEGGGLLSIYYHPAEWVHAEFWDAVNFRRGANPPREEWKAPPQRPRAETEAAYLRFEKYLDFQLSLPGVKHVTASDLPAIYRNRIRDEGADLATIKDIAETLAHTDALDIARDRSGRVVSPAEQFALIVGFLARSVEEQKVPVQVGVGDALGPSERPPVTEVGDLPWRAFRDALRDASDELRVRGQVPSRVFAGARKMAPADFLRAAAAVALGVIEAGAGGVPPFPEVQVPKGTAIGTERFVAEDTPDLFGGWIIHAEGFRAPRIVEMAKLQAWTLKPADRPSLPSEAREAPRTEGPSDVPREEKFNPARMKSTLVVPVTRVERFRHPVVDTHSHAYAEGAEAIASWVRLMDQVGVRTSLILTGATGEPFRALTARYAGAHPGRFVMLAGFEREGIEEADYGQRLRRRLREDVAAGAVGLGELSDKGLGLVRVGERGYSLDDPRFDPLWEEAGLLGLPVFVHVAEPAAFYEPVDERNELRRSENWSLFGKGTPGFAAMIEKLERVASRHPQTRFVSVHAFNLANDLGAVGALLDRHPNVQIDFAARMWELARQPFTARRFFEKYQDRILFGTDNDPEPAMYVAHARQMETEDEWFWPADAEWWRGYGMGLPDGVLRKVYRANAEALLPALRGR